MTSRFRRFRLLFVVPMLVAFVGTVVFTTWLFVLPIFEEFLGIDPLDGIDLWYTQQTDQESQPHTGVAMALFSPSGHSLIALSEGEQESHLETWSVLDKRLRTRVPWTPPQCDYLLLSNDGSVAVTIDLTESYANGGTPPNVPAQAKSWDVSTGKQISEVTLSTTPIWSAAISLNGKVLAIGTGDHWKNVPGTVEIWDLETRKLQNSIRQEKATVTALAFSPDGRYVVVGTGIPHAYPQPTGELLILDSKNLNEVTSLSGHSTGITQATFSSDGSTLATVGYRRPVLVWDTQTWQLRASIDESKANDFSVDSVALSPDGSILATGHTYSVLLWDTYKVNKIGSIDVPLRLGGVKAISFGQNDLLVLPSHDHRLTPFTVDVHSGLAVSWEVATPTVTEGSQPNTTITYRQLAAWRRRLKRRITALQEVEPETKEVLFKFAAEARPGAREAELLKNVGLASDIDFLWKSLAWQSAFTQDATTYRLLLFKPVFFAVPPGSPPETVAILDSHDRLVHWQEIGGGGHGFESASLETENGRTVLSMRWSTRAGRPETTKYLVSPKSIEKFHVRPVETKIGPVGDLEKLGAVIGTGLFSTKVTSVSFAGTDIGDENLGEIVTLLLKCSELERLDLSRTKITSAGLAHLQNLAFHNGDGAFRGPTLALDGTQIDDDGLEYIQHMMNLRELNLSETNIHGAGLAFLKGFVNLEQLSLSSTKIDDAGIADLPALPSLLHLSIDGTFVSDAGLERLSLLGNLQYLALDNTQVTGPGLRHLSALTELRNLSLSGAQVTGEGLEHLSSLSKLEELQLLRTPLTDDALEHVGKIASLARLDISLTAVGNEGVSHLRRLKNLDYLYLHDTNISDDGVNALLDLPACSYLDVRGTKLTEAGFDRLRAMPSLHWLNCSEPKEARMQ